MPERHDDLNPPDIVKAADETELSFMLVAVAIALTTALLVSFSGVEYLVEPVVGLLPSVVKKMELFGVELASDTDTESVKVPPLGVIAGGAVLPAWLAAKSAATSTAERTLL